MKQTAVEWLEQELESYGSNSVKIYFELFNKAKEMERQQIIEFAEWYKDIVNSTAYQDKDCQRLFQKTTSELYEEFIKTYGGNK